MQDDFEFNDESLHRHGISRLEAIQVMKSDYVECFPLSYFHGNSRAMFVGFSETRIYLLEVGIEFLPNGKEKIFHANKARKFFTKAFEERKR